MGSKARSYDATVGPGRRARLRLAVPLVACLAIACDDPLPADPSLRGALDAGAAGRWTTTSPEAQGLDRTVLEELEADAFGGAFGEVSSLLILRNGFLVYELYEGGWTADDLHPVYSVTKSVTSLGVGVALDEGALPGVTEPLLDLLPGYTALENPDGKDEITLEHVLQMRTGLEWDELSTNYSSGANPVAALVNSPDWIQFVLDLPFAGSPGSSFTYNSGVSMLMAAVLARSLAETADRVVAERIFEPLGIDTWQWAVGPHGLTNTGWGLRLRPRDMAAVGQLVLQGGTWEGTRVVSRPWLDASAAVGTSFVDGTGYGYQWWLGQDDGESRAIAAWGYGGQFVVVVPSLDMVVVSTAENFEGGGFDPYELGRYAYRAAGATPPSATATATDRRGSPVRPTLAARR